MNQRKQNISRWYALGLAAVLVVACLLISVGTSWARYRSQEEKIIYFEARSPLTTCIGKVVYSEDRTSWAFTADQTVAWESVDGQMQLNFAISNGTSAGSHETRDQDVSIRLIGSLGAWSGSETASVKLLLPREETEKAEEVTDPTEETQPVEPITIEAKAVRITAGTTLHNTFGDGWVFYFLDEEGEELTWTLEGGKLSYVEMAMAMDSGTVSDTSLLRLQVSSELAKN